MSLYYKEKTQERLKRLGRESFREIRTMLKMFSDVVEMSKNIDDVTKNYYRFKIKCFEKKFAWKKMEKFIERRHVKRDRYKFGFWLAMALQDLNFSNKENSDLTKIIQKLHSLCFNAVDDYNMHSFPQLNNSSPVISSSSSSSNESSQEKELNK